MIKARYLFIHGQLLEKINFLDSAQKVYNSIIELGEKSDFLDSFKIKCPKNSICSIGNNQ